MLSPMRSKPGSLDSYTTSFYHNCPPVDPLCISPLPRGSNSALVRSTLQEQARLNGIAVDAVFDSVSVATTFREELNRVSTEIKNEKASSIEYGGRDEILKQKEFESDPNELLKIERELEQESSKTSNQRSSIYAKEDPEAGAEAGKQRVHEVFPHGCR